MGIHARFDGGRIRGATMSEVNGTQKRITEGMIDSEIDRLNAAVDAFALDMKTKLAKKAREGFEGWDLTSETNWDFFRQALSLHVLGALGHDDYVDVANFAMMLSRFPKDAWCVERSTKR